MNRRCNLEDTFDCSEKPMSDKEWITGWAGCSGWYTQQGQHGGLEARHAAFGLRVYAWNGALHIEDERHECAEGVTIPLGVLRALGE